VGIVVGAALNVDNAGQYIRVGVEETRAAVGTKLPPAVFGGLVHLGPPLRHLERVLRVHRPSDHRRTGVAAAIRAVTQRMNDGFAFDLVADGAAMTAASDVAHASL